MLPTLLLSLACSTTPPAPATAWFGGSRGGQATLWRVSAAGGEAIAVPGDPDLVAISPAGTRLALWDRDGADVIDTSGQLVRRVTGQFAAFLDDNTVVTTLASPDQPAELSRVDLQTGEAQPLGALPGVLNRRAFPLRTAQGDVLLATSRVHRLRPDGSLTDLPVPSVLVREGPGGLLLGLDLSATATRVWQPDGTVLHSLGPSLGASWQDADHVLLYRQGQTAADGSFDGPMALVQVDLRDGHERVLVTGLPLQDEVWVFPPCVIDADTLISVGPGATSVVRLDLTADAVQTTSLAAGFTRAGHLMCGR